MFSGDLTHPPGASLGHVQYSLAIWETSNKWVRDGPHGSARFLLVGPCVYKLLSSFDPYISFDTAQFIVKELCNRNGKPISGILTPNVEW